MTMPAEVRALLAAYKACDPSDAEALLYVLIRERGPTVILPALLGLFEEATAWAGASSIPELEAYGEACTQALHNRPSGRRLRVHRAIRALRALEPGDMTLFAQELGPHPAAFDLSVKPPANPAAPPVSV